MLYDKRWDKQVETKADPFSLESLIAWLEKQPAKKKYDYFDCRGRCLFGQYAAATMDMSWMNVVVLEGHKHEFKLLAYDIACQKPYTFGAALERARAVMASAD